MGVCVSETTGGCIIPPSVLGCSEGGADGPDVARRSPRRPLMTLDGFQSVPTFCQSRESGGRHSGAKITSVRGREAQACVCPSGDGTCSTQGGRVDVGPARLHCILWGAWIKTGDMGEALGVSWGELWRSEAVGAKGLWHLP
jgi:hypothetical protein